MNSLRAQLLLGVVCLLLGVTLVMQFRTQRLTRGEGLPASTSDQATYISQLYESNAQLRQQVAQLSQEIARYEGPDQNSMDALQRDLQTLRMVNGDTEVTGPGVVVLVNGNLTAIELQDLVNEVRNASAEAIAVNGVRVVTRSAITTDQTGSIIIDHQPIQPPYRIEAIGNPDTLAPALERKGGLIALLEASDPGLNIQVARHELKDQALWLTLPPTTADFTWEHGQPVP
jgi:uncharacterized protein YlxW (UPF0749 family)